MLKRLATAALLSLTLAGCVSGSGGSGSAGLTSSKSWLTITAQGMGGITAETPYSSKSIEAALPGFSTQPIQIAVEDQTLWTTGAFYDGFQVLQVLKGKDGRIGEVHGVTHHLTGPNGERIGMTMGQIGTSQGDCRVGRNLWRGMAICAARGTPNVRLVYAVPGYEGPFDQLPQPDQLRGAILQRIIWSPAG